MLRKLRKRLTEIESLAAHAEGDERLALQSQAACYRALIAREQGDTARVLDALRDVIDLDRLLAINAPQRVADFDPQIKPTQAWLRAFIKTANPTQAEAARELLRETED